MSKQMTASVGVTGRNSPPVDVMTVQYLLNCVPGAQGGPLEELVVDGICGPLTIAAIRRFQQHNFGWADGRVDPGGKTITALQAYDPYPNEAMPLGLVMGKTTGDGTFGKQPGPQGGKVAGKLGGTAGAKSGGAPGTGGAPGGKGV